MPKIEEKQFLYLLTNCLMYGTAKAEMKLAGVSTVLSRMSVDYSIGSNVDGLKGMGLDYEISPDPFECVENYKKLNVEAGLVKDEDFIITRETDRLTLTAPNCLYKLGCSHLIAEGIKEFGCKINASVCKAARASGKRVNCHSVNEPGNCKIYVEIKK